MGKQIATLEDRLKRGSIVRDQIEGMEGRLRNAGQDETTESMKVLGDQINVLEERLRRGSIVRDHFGGLEDRLRQLSKAVICLTSDHEVSEARMGERLAAVEVEAKSIVRSLGP